MTNEIPQDDQWTASDVTNVLCNPVHVFNGTVSRRQWIDAMVKVKDELGLEEMLGRIIMQFDESLGAGGHLEADFGEAFVEKFTGIARSKSYSPRALFGMVLDDLRQVIRSE